MERWNWYLEKGPLLEIINDCGQADYMCSINHLIFLLSSEDYISQHPLHKTPLIVFQAGSLSTCIAGSEGAKMVGVCDRRSPNPWICSLENSCPCEPSEQEHGHERETNLYSVKPLRVQGLFVTWHSLAYLNSMLWSSFIFTEVEGHIDLWRSTSWDYTVVSDYKIRHVHIVVHMGHSRKLYPSHLEIMYPLRNQAIKPTFYKLSCHLLT